MNTPPDIDSLRKAALEELAPLTTIGFGTLSEVYRNRPSPDGSEPVKHVPNTKHQCWENGINRSTYIQAGIRGYGARIHFCSGTQPKTNRRSRVLYGEEEPPFPFGTYG